jgi:uncharacterized membrane protein YbhN (UPF0104 family)
MSDDREWESADAAAVSAVGPDFRTSLVRRVLWAILKLVIIVLVVYALGRHVWTLIEEWREQGEALRSLSFHWAWIAVAALTYVAGQVCFGLFWVRLLRRLGAAGSWLTMLKAYTVGTLGKYVPGKALVVILRSGLLRDSGVSRVSIGLAAVYETIVVMVAGGLLAGACLYFARPDDWVYALGAVAVATGLAATLHPAIFSRFGAVVALPFKDPQDHLPTKCWWRVFWQWGWLPFAGWLLLGGSFWSAAYGMGLECSSLDALVALTGAAALATVIGFVIIFMPAGLGVRELIIIHLLAPRWGTPAVVIATLLLRTIWTAAELGLAGIVYGASSRQRKPD